MKKLEEMKQKRLELTKELRSLELTKEDFDKKVSEINDIDTEISEIEKRNSIISKLSNGTSSNPIQTRAIEKQVDAKSEFVFGVDSPEYRSAFYKKLAEIPLNEVEQRALTTNSSSAGASIPTSTMNKILEKIENGSVVYNLVQVAHLKGQVVIPIEDTTADVERKGEGANGTDEPIL